VRARTDVQKYLWRHRCEYERGTSPWVTCMWYKSLFGHGRDGGGMRTTSRRGAQQPKVDRRKRKLNASFARLLNNYTLDRLVKVVVLCSKMTIWNFLTEVFSFLPFNDRNPSVVQIRIQLSILMLFVLSFFSLSSHCQQSQLCQIPSKHPNTLSLCA